MPRPPILTVVDYDAWDKGYLPPSEHTLIDKLSYRGAKVVLSSWIGGDQHMWVVLEGTKSLTNKQRKMLRDLVALWFDDESEPPKAEPPSVPPPILDSDR